MKAARKVGLVVGLSSVALGCTLLDSDIGLREVSDVRDCFGLSRYVEDGALACFELRDGECEQAAAMSSTKPEESLNDVALSTIVLKPVPTAPDTVLLTAPKCEGSRVYSIATSVLEPALGATRNARLRVVDEGDRPWDLAQFALAPIGPDEAVLFSVVTLSCAEGKPALLITDKSDPTRIELPLSKGSDISCDQHRGARWPAVALSCERGACSRGLATYLTAPVCKTDCERGTVTCRSMDGDVSLRGMRFELGSEGIAARDILPLGSANAAVAPAVLALNLDRPAYVVVHAVEESGGCGKSAGSGVVLRTLADSGDESECVHIPAKGVQRIALGHGPFDNQALTEDLLVVWSRDADGVAPGGTIEGAVVEVGPNGLRVVSEFSLASHAALDIAPAVASAERGASLDPPQGFWSVTWSSASTPKVAMVTRISWFSREPIDTSTVTSNEIGDAVAFAFHSDDEPVSYGVVHVDAKNVASTWALKCAK